MTSDDKYTQYGIIMAGGSGERFWPLSRRNHPKQLLKLTSSTRNMLQEAVDRLAPLIPPERILVVTGAHLVDAIVKSGVGVPDENVLAEPCKRNTAGCLIYAAAHILARHDGDPARLSMAVVTADHLIGEPDRFRESVALALAVAENQGMLVTHGIAPTRPETGYGYVQAKTDAPLHEANGLTVYPVAAFHEKPNEEKAEDFINAGNYYWNSGMFFWSLETFLRELEHAQPAMAETTRAMAQAIQDTDQAAAVNLFESLEDISIDYALMEHAEKVATVRTDYPWDDVGAWPSLDRTRGQDDAGNVTHGDPVLVDVRDSIVYNDVGADNMAVSVIGVDNIIVVVSEDGVLVVPKDEAQHVRKAVSELKDRGADQV
jgi:mannose-1-phosphate guanylyltransferase